MRYVMRKEGGRNFPRRVALRRSRRLLAVAVVVGTCLAGAPACGQRQVQSLVPANFSQKTDSQGYRWDINGHGRISSGTNSCFSNALTLNVNGNSFSSPQSSMMTADGSEYILTRQVSNFQVTRRIKVDPTACAARYVEMIHNPGPAPLTATVALSTQLARGPCQALVTDTGAPAGTTLGEKDTGLIVFGQPSSGQLSILFHLAGARSKIKPTIKNNSNYQFTMTYSVSVGPGQTVSILHGIAQRRLAAIPTGKAAAELFKPFNQRARDWTRDLAREVRRSIVNLGGLSFGGWGGSQALVSLESLGVDPQAADVLAVGQQTRLHGTATCKAFEMQTHYGTLKVSWEKIAAVAGERFTGGKPRVFLRDGQVLNGEITIEDLQFTMNTGLKLDVASENLDRVVLRANTEDGKPAAEVAAMLETTDGDCLALVGAGDQRVAATTPWGDRVIALEEIQWMFATEDRVGHRLVLRDGSRLFAFLDASALSLSTLLFDVQQFRPVQVRRMSAVRLKSPEESAAAEIAVPHVLLAGENVLVGQVDLPAVHFVTLGQKVPVPPNQIRLLRNVTGEVEMAGGPMFEAELWDGGTITGELTELVLPVRAADRVAKVPVHDVLEVRVPTPSVPDTMQSKIAQLIRDLGHPEYATRKAAKEALAEMGHLPKMQLNETLKTTSDPEVRRSVEELLEELE